MDELLPYKAEYAKSGRASCKGCKQNIAKDSLRLAVMVQSPMFDGKVPHWYHQMCFFGKQRPKTVADIAHFDSLRWEDQEKIKAKVANGGAGGGGSTTGGKGGGKKGKGGAKGGFNDYTVEYAKSGRAVCRGCMEKILKGEVRISKKDYDDERAKMYGPVERWHHLDCFVKKRSELEFYESGENLPGFFTLSADDKKVLKEKLKPIAVKRKTEDETDTPVKKIKTEEEETMRKQNKIMYRHRDELSRASLTRNNLSLILEDNNQYIPTGESKMLEIISDIMTFGALEPCQVCGYEGFMYESGKGYVCHGNLTEWTRCTNVEKDPKRRPFIVPQELKDKIPYLSKYKFLGVDKRVWIDHGPTSAELAKKKENGSVSSDPNKPLEGMKFVISGKSFTKDNKKSMKDKIQVLGGQVSSKVTKETAAVITTPDEVGGMSKHISQAKELNVHCVDESFLEEVTKGGALLMIPKKSIASWGGNVQERVFPSKSSKSESRYTKSIPEKQKIKLKGGAAVDPDSELVDVAHVYQKGNKLYNCVLGLVNLMKGTNSYYKMQVLESDKKNRWWVFRSWGRIGTTIGNNKLERVEDLLDAVRQFESLYEEKTGNTFSGKGDFKKVPGCWYPLDIDYGQEEEVMPKFRVEGSKSKLAKPVQELVALIFDVDTMKKSLVEFEIDTKKMPLGKLSKKQIERAYRVLSEALALMEKNEKKPEVNGGCGSDGSGSDGSDGSSSGSGGSGDGSGSSQSAAGIKAQLLDCSNRFYTLIPHDFGMKTPPLLDDLELIKNKIAMLDNLSEIEIAYSLLKSEGDQEDKEADPIDKHYRKLKTKIEVMDEKCDEYKMIQDYVTNTHATTHSHYKLVVDKAFKIERQGEKKRYKPFKQLPNRQLLWHGSRLTNFAGILSQGLRIAPPEAPVTGYMFGKGVYFADMVSKSANYCCTSLNNSTGLILLCEVALGNMYERTGADYIEKLPSNKHSTKGLGKTCPDPKETIRTEDGVEVPLGKGVPSQVKNTSLLYNEYIVYDVAQVNAKYLLKLDFQYKF